MADGDSSTTSTLQEELDQFLREKEEVRQIVGRIGSVEADSRDKLYNILFIVAIATLFFLDILREILSIHVPVPAMLSVELGLLLVSIKIIWMIRKAARVEHFQFWILNSIEFRLNDMAKRIRNIEKNISPGDGTDK